MKQLYKYSEMMDENLYAACSGFRNTTSQSVSVLVKALSSLEDGAMLSQASFDIGRPEHVFNFSQLLTRHEMEEKQSQKMDIMNKDDDNNNNSSSSTKKKKKKSSSNKKKEKKKKTTTNSDKGDAITIMQKLKQEEKEDEADKGKHPTGLSTFFNRWLRL